MPLQTTVPVFVSSTSLDLRPEREAVRDVVLGMKETQFVGMEYFGSLPEDTRRASLDKVDESKVYVGIFAGRYGSGITEAEYRRARERGLPCLIYFKDDASVPEDLRETDPEDIARLRVLKAELKGRHTVNTFDTPDGLAAQVAVGLHNWLFKEYLTPILERAASGELPFAQAQALLSGVRDKSALSPGLLAQLTARHQLRAPVGDFVGREKEIDGLLATLRGGGSAVITGISGMGGIGKTELSFYVAERLRDTYPDAQLVLDMGGTDDAPRDPSDALASCIRAFLGLEQRLPDDTGELTRIYRSTLEGKRALILLDNASDSAQVRPLLPPQGSALLITSRNAVALPGMRTRVTLDQLSPAEARELLTGIAPSVSGDAADRICYLCGYLPLAVRAAGSLLAVTADLDPEDYASQLADERTRLELLGTEGVDIGVEASFNLSYARLSTDAARVFRRLAVFPATFDADAEETICEDPGHKHLSDLLRRNLVLYNPDTRRYRLHDLARLFAIPRLGRSERKAVEKFHAQHYLGVLEECDSLFLRGGEPLKHGLALFEVERKNTDSGQAWADRNVGKDRRAASLYGEYLNVGGTLFHMRLHPREYIARLKRGLTIARLCDDRPLQGRLLNDLGWAYSDLGDIQGAVGFYEQALHLYREAGDRAGEGSVLNNLSGAYLNLGKNRRALTLMKRVAVIMREEGLRREEGMALRMLGGAYAALGEARRALEYYEQGLNIACELGDLIGEGQALSDIGHASTHLGNLRRAVEAHKRHLDIARELGDRREEGSALSSLGVVYFHMGDIRLAIGYFEQYLDITREVGDRLSEAGALGNLGGAYAQLGESRRAIELIEQCLNIAREIGDKSTESDALSNLGFSYCNLREYEPAIKFYGQSLKINRRTGDRRREGDNLCKLGMVYSALGESRRALELYQQQLDIARELGNRNGEGTALWNMSLLFRKTGDLSQAVSHAEAALGIHEEIEHPRVERIRRKLYRWREEATKGE